MGKTPGLILPTYKEQKKTGEIHEEYPGKPRFKAELYKGKESKDERHIILKQIYEDESISNNMIGYFDDFDYTHKFDKNMTNILPHITECKYTLCFNWPGQEEHLTSRYNEALASDIIPLVWQNYDCMGRIVGLGAYGQMGGCPCSFTHHILWNRGLESRCGIPSSTT